MKPDIQATCLRTNKLHNSTSTHVIKNEFSVYKYINLEKIVFIDTSINLTRRSRSKGARQRELSYGTKHT